MWFKDAIQYVCLSSISSPISVNWIDACLKQSSFKVQNHLMLNAATSEKEVVNPLFPSYRVHPLSFLKWLTQEKNIKRHGPFKLYMKMTVSCRTFWLLWLKGHSATQLTCHSKQDNKAMSKAQIKETKHEPMNCMPKA